MEEIAAIVAIIKAGGDALEILDDLEEKYTSGSHKHLTGTIRAMDAELTAAIMTAGAQENRRNCEDWGAPFPEETDFSCDGDHAETADVAPRRRKPKG